MSIITLLSSEHVFICIFFGCIRVNTEYERLWERLGFTKAGLIPKAGRLKKRGGEGEEFVDAWVYYKSFV
jgi:hypothetical protein